MPPQNNQHDLRVMLDKNQKLLEENNKLLKHMNRRSLVGFWFGIIWYALILGLPFIFYFYILQPYFAAFGSDFSTFEAGMREIPGWKQFQDFLDQAESDVAPKI